MKRPSPRILAAHLLQVSSILFASASLVQPALAQEDAPNDSLDGAAVDSNTELSGSSDTAFGSESPEGEQALELEATSDTEVVEEGGGLFESATSAGETESASELSLQWSGYVRGDVFIGKDKPTGDPGINAAYGEISLQPLVKAGSWGGAFADLRVRYGQQLDQKDLIVDLREAYASAYLGPVELRLGKQIVVWGRADGFNPTNNISAVDFRIRSPIEDDRRVGNVGARGFLSFNPVRLEAVWMPLYEPTMYPTVEINDGITTFVEPRYPTLSVRDSLIAGRAHLELSAFDASVSYVYGNAPLPGIDLESFAVGSETITGDPDVRAYVNIRRRSYRQHVIGADFSTAVSDWFGLRGEGAYRMPVDYQNRPWAAKPDAQWVLGIDREFGPVNIIAQYLGRYTFDWEGRRPEDSQGTRGLYALNPNNPADVERGYNGIMNALFNTNQTLFNQLYQLQTLASLRVEWKTLHETLTFSVLGLYNFNTQEYAIMPKAGYNITGGLTAYLGAEIYGGKPGTLMDLIDDKLTSGYAELRASF